MPCGAAVQSPGFVRHRSRHHRRLPRRGRRGGGVVRAASSRRPAQYFLAGHGVPWWAISASIVATETSTITFISVPGIAYARGGDFTFLQLVFGYLVGRVVISHPLHPVVLPRRARHRLPAAAASASAGGCARWRRRSSSPCARSPTACGCCSPRSCWPRSTAAWPASRRSRSSPSASSASAW